MAPPAVQDPVTAQASTDIDTKPQVCQVIVFAIVRQQLSMAGSFHFCGSFVILALGKAADVDHSAFALRFIPFGGNSLI